MLLYVSDKKIENLYREFNINRNFIDSIMPENMNAKLDINIGVADGSIEGQYNSQDTNHIHSVLKKLKKNNKLIELTSGDTYIRPLNYYVCDGILSYIRRIDGQTATWFRNDVLNKYRGELFFSDDKLNLHLKISHDIYKYIDFNCTADSTKTLGGRVISNYYPEIFKNSERVYYPFSDDPGILSRKLPVRLIFWCLETNEALGYIIGSPLIMTC